MLETVRFHQTAKAVINSCYFKNRVILTQNYSLFKITIINNSFYPSYASYPAKYAPLSKTVHGYELPTYNYKLHKQSFVTNSLFKYYK